MEILTKNELRLRRREIVEKIKQGAIFIHPTDTIYGIGCNALNEKSINKIRKLKERHTTPFSVWAPSQNWIKQNSKKSIELDKWLKELPGRYTLIVELETMNCVSNNTNPEKNSLGVRMPDHWFHEIVAESGIPIITTSANKTGHEFMTSLENLDPEIKRDVDFIIYEGEKKARPSKLINVVEEKITER